MNPIYSLVWASVMTPALRRCCNAVAGIGKKGVRGENARCEGHEEELAKGENARASARSMGCIMRRGRNLTRCCLGGR